MVSGAWAATLAVSFAEVIIVHNMFLTSIRKRTGNWGVHSIIPKAIFKDGMAMDTPMEDPASVVDDEDSGESDEQGELDSPPADFEDEPPSDDSSAMTLIFSNGLIAFSALVVACMAILVE